MTARAISALLSAMAAVALLVAGFMPWFVTEVSEDDDGDARADAAATRPYLPDPDSDRPRRDWDDPSPAQVRGNFGLVSGETCVRLRCKPARYTGAPGLADDAFAWLGRATLGAALAGVALLVAVALAARTQRRPILRGWAATVAATAAGLGAAFASTQTLAGLAGFVERGVGLGAIITGAALAGLGAAWPWRGRGDASATRRALLVLCVAGLAALAWITLVQHAWWRSGRSLDLLRVSPLGVEVCDSDGSGCRLSTALGAWALLRALACATALASAALLVPAFGTAARVARGIAPGAWAWSTAVLACLALGAGLATWASYPANDVMRVGWGLPVFAVAMAGVGAAAVVAAIQLRTRDSDELAEAAVAPPAAGALAPGARPVLAALGAAPAVREVAPSPAVAAAPVSPYAPKPAAPSAPSAPSPAPAPRSPYPRPQTPAPTAAGALARRSSPTCPTCRVATLWHGKRGAWWCSTCKQTV